MAHSYRHTPIFGHTCASSEKEDKQIAHRAFRKLTKQAIAAGRYDRMPANYRLMLDVWSMAKDGKSYWMPKWHNQLETWRRSMRK